MFEAVPRKRFKAGGIIFRQGDVGDCAYIIRSGTVQIINETENGSAVIAVVGPDQLIGEMAIIDDQPRSATARAAEDCELAPISREQISRRVERIDPVVKLLFKLILSRLRNANHRHGTDDKRRAPPDDDLVPGDAETFKRLNLAALQALEVESELANAFTRGQFALFYQPIIRLSDGTLAGFEALLRWRHPVRGFVSPVEFVPMLEDSGLIVPVGRWILREAINQMQIFRSRGYGPGLVGPEPFMSVNVSAVQLASGRFLDDIGSVLDGRPLSSPVKLEVTEGIFLENPSLALSMIESCKARGFHISIDDFGTGYSSLGYLSQYPVDTLKIDRSFITPIISDPKTREIVKAIITLAKGLGMDIVAEGIEEPGQASFLGRLGCDYGQGFLYSRPVPDDQALALVTNWRPRPAADEVEDGDPPDA